LSPSLSLTHGLVRAWSSIASGSMSASSSVSRGFGVPSLSQSPPTSGPIIGFARRLFASRLIRREMTLTRNRVGTRAPFTTSSSRSIFRGTITVSCVFVECSERT
jgi:hypothetical protein